MERLPELRRLASQQAKILVENLNGKAGRYNSSEYEVLRESLARRWGSIHHQLNSNFHGLCQYLISAEYSMLESDSDTLIQELFSSDRQIGSSIVTSHFSSMCGILDDIKKTSIPSLTASDVKIYDPHNPNSENLRAFLANFYSELLTRNELESNFTKNIVSFLWVWHNILPFIESAVAIRGSLSSLLPMLREVRAIYAPIASRTEMQRCQVLDKRLSASFAARQAKFTADFTARMKKSNAERLLEIQELHIVVLDKLKELYLIENSPIEVPEEVDPERVLIQKRIEELTETHTALDAICESVQTQRKEASALRNAIAQQNREVDHLLTVGESLHRHFSATLNRMKILRRLDVALPPPASQTGIAAMEELSALTATYHGGV
jgi:hypothetical protein